MNLAVLMVMILLIVLLLTVYFRLSPKRPPEAGLPAVALDETLSGTRTKSSPCPLCKTLLVPGERVHSVVYPGKGDRLVEIYGCPYCYPPNRRYPRYCPSCSRPLQEEELIFARLFENTGKVHVHVNGCRVCMRGHRIV